MPQQNSVRSACSFAHSPTLRLIAFLTLATLLLNGLALSQTTTTLVPTSYITTAGNASSQPVASSIDLLDESGTTNTFSKYVEFNTNQNAIYAGYQLFTLPTSIAPSSVTAIQVKANYQGPATAIVGTLDLAGNPRVQGAKHRHRRLRTISRTTNRFIASQKGVCE